MKIQNLIENTANYLLETKPDDYFTGTNDYGYYNNGVGMACYGYENVYDESRAAEDAKQALLDELDILAGKKQGYSSGDLDEIFKIDEVYNFIKQLIVGEKQ